MTVMRRGLRTVSVLTLVSVLLVGILVSSLNTMSSSRSVAVTASTPADMDGPLFPNIGNMFVDTTLITTPVELHPTLRLHVDVWDEETVDLTIGCYKRTNETQWSNITMTLLGYSQLDPRLHYFGANATEFTLSPSYPCAVWNVKYYAHDSADRWNVSDVANISVNALYDLGPVDTTPVITGSQHLILAAVTVAIMATAIIWLVRRENSAAESQ